MLSKKEMGLYIFWRFSIFLIYKKNLKTVILFVPFVDFSKNTMKQPVFLKIFYLDVIQILLLVKNIRTS